MKIEKYSGFSVCPHVARLAMDPSTVKALAFVLPAYRRQGIYSLLLDTRLFDFRVWRITCVATEMSEPILQSRGFIVTSRTKKYARMEKSLYPY